MKKFVLKFFIITLFLGTFFISRQVHAATKISPYATCINKNGRAVCRPNYSAIRQQTARVIINGWINYGPWQPRPGFGVIIP